MTDSLKVKFIQATVILGIPILKKDLGHWLQRQKTGMVYTKRIMSTYSFYPHVYLRASWYFMIIIPGNSRQEKDVI